MTLSIIAAVSSNNVIGKNGRLPWHLPADLRYFKERTIGHYIIMGRKSFESIGKKALPGRKTIVITRQNAYQGNGCLVVHSLANALDAVVGDNEPFICGGAEIYNQSLEIANKLYITRIHQKFEGDTFFPALDMRVWKEINRSDALPDYPGASEAKNLPGFSFCVYERIGK